MAMPAGDLVSNWAYLVMASLAWSLKAWSALLLLPESGRWGEKYRAEKRSLLRMEFRTFLCGDDGGALPDRAWWAPPGVPAAVVESVAGCVPALGGAITGSPVVLRGEKRVKPRSVCLGPYWHPTRRGGVVMVERESAVENRAQYPRPEEDP